MMNDFKLLRGKKQKIKLVSRVFDWEVTTTGGIRILPTIQPIEMTFEMNNSEIIDRWMTVASRGMIVNSGRRR